MSVVLAGWEDPGGDPVGADVLLDLGEHLICHRDLDGKPGQFAPCKGSFPPFASALSRPSLLPFLRVGQPLERRNGDKTFFSHEVTDAKPHQFADTERQVKTQEEEDVVPTPSAIP